MFEKVILEPALLLVGFVLAILIIPIAILYDAINWSNKKIRSRLDQENAKEGEQQ